ncbi:MAG: pyridoxal phosphate-dependent aminotransferase [Bacteroidales bacterium]|nr:pyridoxal phosphate-dependent aminotransferase [Bacteroidales bacterium]
MSKAVFPREVVDRIIAANGIKDVSKASIRQVVKIVRDIEEETGVEFVKMEMGVPGLKPAQVGVDAEIEALKNGCASIYPPIEGLPELKTEMSRFVKNFLDITVSPESCIPTVGSMQASFAAFLTAGRRDAAKTKTLFIDPGFPVQKQQLKMMGLPFETFDVYNYRGEALREKLESYCSKGDVATIVYSSPNNPSWICFTDTELRIIADIVNKYDIVVVEDLAYFAMDFRKDYGQPGVAPFQPTIAKYTDNYILLISASKAFSYAGQRIASLVISDALYSKKFPDLLRFYAQEELGRAMIYGAVYAMTSGTAFSAQYAFVAILKAANEGKYNFRNDILEYGNRAKQMKDIFVANGFEIVYDYDMEQPVGDGFYFTVGYPGMTGGELLAELLYYGISAITLDITGSDRQGLRACTSQMSQHKIDLLKDRAKLFNEDHK